MNIPRVSLERPFQSEDFAVLLGLKESPLNDDRNSRNEVEKLASLIYYVERNRIEDELQQDIIWAEFCAQHLPATVNHFMVPSIPTNQLPDIIEDQELYNAYFQMLVMIQHSPYFAKYLRSENPLNTSGKELTQVLAQRLLALSPRWDGYMRSPSPDRPPLDYFTSVLTSAMQLLRTLLTFYNKVQDQSTIIPQETKTKLLFLARQWGRRYSGIPLGGVCMDTWCVLSGEKKFKSGVARMRTEFKNWGECGMPTCSKTVNLKACGRCQTIRYCSGDHQRMHWNAVTAPHKQMCYKTNY